MVARADSVAATKAIATLSAGPSAATWADSAGARLDGATVSSIGSDLRILAVGAQADDSGIASGVTSFVHVAPAGVSRFVGTVACFRQDGGGQVQLSGQVLDGVTAAGVVLTGKDFFFTLEADGGPQAFSLPSFAEAGTRSGCSGGGAQRVAVTAGSFVLTDA